MLTLSDLQRSAGKKDKKRLRKGQSSGWGHQAG